jgi:23S rRNA pseudouridine2605 synthase
MLEAVGHAVSRLIRIRYGAMVLPRGLKRGAWMELDESDIRALVRAAEHRPGSDGATIETGDRAQAQGRPGGGRNRRRGGPQGQGSRPAGGPSGGGAPRGKGRGQAGRGKDRSARQGGGEAQPDPMKTSFGYIGADSFSRQRQDQRRRGGGGGGGSSGSRRGGRSR